MTQTLTAEQHFAMEGEAPFPLPDVATLSAGRKIQGAKARVYWLLRTTAEQGIHHRIGRSLGPAGWVPNYYLRKAWSGGNAGDRRLRDLRERYGVQVETSRFSEDSSTVLFRWSGDVFSAPARNGVSGATVETSDKSHTGFLPRIFCERGTSGPVSDDRASTGLLRLRFWTSVGFPGDDAPGRLQILGGFNEHPLTFAPYLLTQVFSGKLDAGAALAAYDNSLKARWPQLKVWLERKGDWTLWLAPEVVAAIDPLPLLVEILGKCGAEYQGDWQSRKPTNANESAGVG